MTIAIICTAILATLVFALGFNVSRLRGVTAKVGGNQLPTEPDDSLFIAIRAHGNAAEYVPTLVVLFLLVGARTDTWWASSLLIIGGTVARLMHAYGMLSASSLAAESKVRMAGAFGTYGFGIALAVAAVTSI